MKKSICFVAMVLVAGAIWFGQNPKNTGGGSAKESSAGTTAVALRHGHAPAMIHERHGSSATSGNWSGYAVTGPNGSVTDVKGSWIVPTVNCSVTPNGDSSFWVGIDGFSSNTVEQIGTDSDCVNGQPVYYAWYEFYPHWSYGIQMTITPGDTILATVSAGAKGVFTVTLTDVTSGAKPFTISQKMNSAAQSSAEWIAEAPSSGGILPLADFGLVEFGTLKNKRFPSTCYATVGGAKATSQPIGFYVNDFVQITMVGSGGTTKASPSSLTNGGASFTETWLNAGP
jgi:hypothetical protein